MRALNVAETTSCATAREVVRPDLPLPDGARFLMMTEVLDRLRPARRYLRVTESFMSV
ncbi:hypothetical protein GCM10010411_73340 [Actinomadura fulvescens]|uniref:Uncharacterized protein n=1 Tax=Actinomadura fulvescens TaxID=46160 RepID=A0ABP6CV70_9ACTN